VFQVLIEASKGQTADSAFSPPGLLWLGGTLILLGTVGILATSRIALAVLLGLGPVFVVLALFRGTRGLFVGWLKGVVLLALAPLFAVLGGSLMLDLSVPVLSTLVQTSGHIDPQAAMAFFMIGAVHTALMVLVMKVVGTMVSGWTVFGLANTPLREAAEASPHPRHVVIAAPSAATAIGQARTAAPVPSQQIRLASAAAANDFRPRAAGGHETRVVGGGARAGDASAGQFLSRAQGVGSRFRAAPVRHSEKVK